jgi:hypothetical protein
MYSGAEVLEWFRLGFSEPLGLGSDLGSSM